MHKLTEVSSFKLRFIYSDNLRHLLDEDAIIQRASHVEPCGTKWTADLTPVGGPILGPFDTRQQAIEEEVLWLNSNISSIELKGM